LEEGVGVVDNVFNGGVVDNLAPEEEEGDFSFSGGFVVAEGKFEGGGQVNPEEAAVLEGFKSFGINVGVASVVAHGLEDRTISVTSLVVFSVGEQVVDGSPSKIPITHMSFVIEGVEDVFEGLVEGVDSSSLHKILIILAVDDALEGFVHGDVQGNDFSGIDVDVGVITSNEGTSEVVEGLEVLEIVFSGDVVPAGDGIGLGEIESSPETIVIIIKIKEGSIDGIVDFFRVIRRLLEESHGGVEGLSQS